ncbi:MAG: class I SAM-dependent methyltransferase [Roseburia sp.]|nr:class I SAM-dependent methyltransferase [Roseburia sp.]
MNNQWSDFIQTTQELYMSREARFTDQNKDLWIGHIGVRHGMKVLEIGCGGGVFCHKLKKYIPDLDITGLDRDTNHIKYAREKAEELGLDCTFTEGEIGSLPFADETFDLVYSHTVAEHVAPELFFGEQHRVLKPGGRFCVLSVRTRLNLKDMPQEEPSDEEKQLMGKLWSKAGEVSEQYQVGEYEMDEHEYPHRLNEYGFRDVDVQMFNVMDYCPDNHSVSEEEAAGQINSRRLISLDRVRKGIRLAPEALTEKERERLESLINERYDKRLAKYRAGIPVWDFTTSCILAVSGVK